MECEVECGVYNLVNKYIPAARLQSPDVISHLLRHDMRD